MRLIDADALRPKLDWNCNALRILDAAPTVRCHDCQFYIFDMEDSMRYVCYIWSQPRQGHRGCSEFERRTCD